MKILYTILCVMGAALLFTQPIFAQENTWPKTMATNNGGLIKIYQWQPESYSDNTLKARAAISVLEAGKSDPVFGMAWLKATTQTNGDQVLVQSARISSVKLPGESDEDKLDNLRQMIEEQIPAWGITFTSKELQSSLDLHNKQTSLAQEISNTPPRVIYSNTPSILVLIDGAPRLQRNNDWGVDAVVNSPFTIVKNNNGDYYLFGGKHWYKAPAATGPYSLTTNVPSNLTKISQAIKDADKDDDKGMESDQNTIYNIIVSTEPAELVQSKGEANFAPVEGTGLLYVSNTDDDIFMDINSQQYYVLLSGRWYNSKTLSGKWQYVSSTDLPADFARIPEGSAKDNVLASVAGTPAAKDALRQAEVPQTARVDRKSAKANIAYDGDPEFESIDGTDMYYATNTSSSVIRWRGRYYAVDNGVWFDSYSAFGPWTVAVVRPYPVALIPPRYPIYNVKYVYIYDVTPDFVYMGYTPGYLNTFIYGPTVVFGTGFYYRPWYRSYYYPRPCTWGYGVRYNPWFGWGFGFNYNAGWFHLGISFGSARPWGYWGGCGWWGPRYYRMPYCYSAYRAGVPYGYYNNRYYEYRNNSIVYANRTTNIYNYRRDVITRDNQRVIAPAAINNNGRRDFAGYNNNNRRFDDRQRNFSNSPDNRGNRYNNRNGEVRNDRPLTRNFDRSNRTDFPQSRDREISERPNRTYTPPSGGGPVRREFDRPYSRPSNGNGSGNRETLPGREWRGSNNMPRNFDGERPGRISAPQNREPAFRGGGMERRMEPRGGGSGGFNRGGGGRPSGGGRESHGGGRPNRA